MSHSTDPGHFFQTDASEATRARRLQKSTNTHGNPLKLPSKLLDILHPSPLNPHEFLVAESAGCIRLVNTKSRDIKSVYRGPAAPVTSIAIGGKNDNLLFAGCWDKDIWCWDRSSKSVVHRLKGHSDFVKTIVTARLQDTNILISGGADSKIILWNADTFEKIYVIRDEFDSMRALQSLIIDPFDTTSSSLVLFSASSDPLIRRWQLTLARYTQTTPPSTPLKAHETSVYALAFPPSTPDDEDIDIDTNLYTASADGSASRLSRPHFTSTLTLPHNDYVRAIALSTAYILTAGRSEDIKVWEREGGELRAVFEGHYEEVTGLCVVEREGGEVCVSVGIDGTVREWELSEAGFEGMRREREERVRRERGEVEEVVVREGVMTAEEEAELAELMDESE